MSRTSSLWSVPIRKANYLRNSAASDALGNGGMTHSINAQRRIKRASPHFLGPQCARIGRDHCFADVLLGQFVSLVVIPKISMDHGGSSRYPTPSLT
jgi:hypothetical protein